jgi:hypothetical protein
MNPLCTSAPGRAADAPPCWSSDPWRRAAGALLSRPERGGEGISPGVDSELVSILFCGITVTQRGRWEASLTDPPRSPNELRHPGGVRSAAGFRARGASKDTKIHCVFSRNLFYENYSRYLIGLCSEVEHAILPREQGGHSWTVSCLRSAWRGCSR